MKEVVTFCNVCYKEFKRNSIRRIRRTKKTTRSACTDCDFRMGYEYEITEK
jgi:RNase P subunit RPR2